MNKDGWTPITQNGPLPEKDVWVQVVEDDRINPDDLRLKRILKDEPRHRVVPAMLLYVDDGWPVWYLCYVGSTPVRHTRNESHWRPMTSLPEVKLVCCGDYNYNGDCCYRKVHPMAQGT